MAAMFIASKRFWDRFSFLLLAIVIAIVFVLVFMHHLSTSRWTGASEISQLIDGTTGTDGKWTGPNLLAQRLRLSPNFWRISDDVIRTGKLRNSSYNLDDDVSTLEADDSRLIRYVREELIVPSSAAPYNLSNPEKRDFSQYGQSKLVDKFLDGMRSGFFVECGALDGERFSNTLYFERHSSWTGILIEPDPQNFRGLVSKNRHSYAINVGLSPRKHATVANFTGYSGGGGMQSYWSEYKRRQFGVRARTTYYRQLCLPIYTILLAMNVRRVDYFSLDVEGAEMDILRTIPFAKIDIRLIAVEYSVWEGDHSDPNKARVRLKEIRDFFHSKPHYKEIHKGVSDVFFQKTK